MIASRRRLIPLLVAACAALAPVDRAAADDKPVDFNREVRPILSGNCLKCHGIDDGSRKAKLRLDVRDSALKGGKSGDPAIVPGKPDDSELVKRIFASDPDDLMPPSNSNLKLTDAQKQTLKQWIAQGAKYETHWAFVPPKQAALPEVKQTDWPRNAIDRFVLARLESEGLHPSPEADRYTLCRRLYLDLIGLPPTPAEADAFVNDASPDAYEKLVDRLLASPHYGERWARRWLDLARYADTNGFEKDRPRSIWPYRDWVIKAFNADMPFDQFTVKQIAGDMLPNATVDDRIATGFHRNTMLNEEGGVDPQEYRYLAMVDRNATTGTAWLGLTVQCAQCHTHKYDPITHADYYRLMALMDDADEPVMEIPDPAVAAKRAEVERRIEVLEAALPQKWPVDGNKVIWSASTAGAVTTANGSVAEPADDGAWRFTGPGPDRDSYTVEFDTAASPLPLDRLRLEALKDAKVGPGRTAHGNFVLSAISVTVAPKGIAHAAKPVKLARADADFSQQGYPIASVLDPSKGGGWGVAGAANQKIGPHTATFFFAEPVTLPQGAHWVVKLDQNYGGHHTLAKLRLTVGAPTPEPTDARPIAERRHDAVDRAFAAWLKSETPKAVRWTVLQPGELSSNGPYLTAQPDHSILAAGDVAKSVTYDLSFHTTADGQPLPANVTALRLEALPDHSLPADGPGMVSYEGQPGDFFLSEIALKSGDAPLKFAKAAQTFGSPAAHAIDGDPQSGWSILGGAGKPHVATFALEKPTGATPELKLHMLCERYYASPIGHFRISVTTDPRAAQPSAMLSDVEAALVACDGCSESQRQLLFRHFLDTTPELADARKEIDSLRASMPKLTTTLVMRERPANQPRTTYIHHRGEFLQTEAKVEPAVPAFLPQLHKDQPADRLALARWLVSPDNPLTARVQVNRQWHAFFGRGIVRTLGDFGYQGDLPTHPELLDWLAVQFMKDGWSFKQLDRLIVSSATYRQSSLVTPDLLSRDPDNLLLARGPRFRLDAEQVRDAALTSAGLLSEKIGGPSVFPPQPPSVTTEGTYGAFTWTVSTGEDRYRRSLYTFAKRTAPFALYNTFDAPTGEQCVVRRDVSDSALQALSLLNDTIFVEAAQALGKTYGPAKATAEQTVTDIFRRCLTRPPETDELALLVAFANKEHDRLAANPAEAAKIAGLGDGDPIDRATWTTVARAVLNFDEAITKE